MTSFTGKVLGKYKVAERLGRGGMAEVYKAIHPHLERQVAIKILHSPLAEGQDFQKFLAEAGLRRTARDFGFDVSALPAASSSRAASAPVSVPVAVISRFAAAAIAAAAIPV